MKKPVDDPQGYLERIRPLYVRLFRMAHAIVGNLELSEYVLKSAIVEAYLRRGEWLGRMSFQEGLAHTVRQIALAELRGMRAAGTFELDWTFPAPADGTMDAAFTARFLREAQSTQRVILLFYGCDLTAREIAQVMKLPLSDVNGRLRKTRARLARTIHKAKNPRLAAEEKLEAYCRAALLLPGEDVAEMGQVFRSFERDVDGASRPRPSAGRVAGVVFKVLFALLLAGAIWLMAVLLEPTARVSPSATDTAAESRENIG